MSPPVLDRHFTLRKLHSLLGLIPIGAFLIFHLFENSLARLGPDYFFVHVVKKIDEMPYVQFMELFVIFVPIILHAIYGIVIWVRGKSNIGIYRTYRNWMYWLQRITGIVALAFIVTHVWTTRMQVLLGNLTKEELFGAVAAFVQDPWGLAVYIVGILSAVIHLSNGLWLMGVTWGLTIGLRAQKISTCVTAAVGLLLLLFAGLSLTGFLTYDPAAVAQAAAH